MDGAKGSFMERGIDEVDFQEEEEEEIDKEIQCGIWCCCRGPNCQKLASKKSTFLIFSIVAMFCGASYAYNTGIITTMEKQYKFSNKKIGVIIGFSEITSILGAFLVPYYASAQGNFPKWIGIGVLLYALSFILNGLPYFIYGPGKDALANTVEYGSIFRMNDTADMKWNTKYEDMCMANKTQKEDCGNDQADEYPGVAIILSISALVLGSAEAFIIPLAISYLDNNVKKSKMPMMLTLTSFIRMLAPLVGFSLAALCLKLYVDPSLHPTIKDDDPRWIGAWWVGWFVLAAVLIIGAPVIASFPKVLPRQALRNKEKLLKEQRNGGIVDDDGTGHISLEDFLITLKRLFTNKVLICNNLASVFYIFGYIPYFKYQAKYIEVQYLFTASKANMITGTASLIFTAVGFLIGGTVIQKTRPTARKLAGWNVIASTISIFGIIGWAMSGCNNNNNVDTLKLSSLQSSCNTDCHCDYVKYMPVCGDNLTYISPCHAGCQEKITFTNKSYVFSNCNCVLSNTSELVSNVTTLKSTYTDYSTLHIENIAQNGPCPVDCMKPFYIFLAIMCFTKFIKGTEGMANFLLGIRCVDQKDKPISLGLSSAMISLFSFLPSPIFFGYIIDKTCILWGKTCGKEGNCWLYDTESMRLNLNLIACGFIFIGTLFDIGTFYYSKDVKIFDEEENKDKEMKPMNKKSG